MWDSNAFAYLAKRKSSTKRSTHTFLSYFWCHISGFHSLVGVKFFFSIAISFDSEREPIDGAQRNVRNGTSRHMIWIRFGMLLFTIHVKFLEIEITSHVAGRSFVSLSPRRSMFLIFFCFFLFSLHSSHVTLSDSSRVFVCDVQFFTYFYCHFVSHKSHIHNHSQVWPKKWPYTKPAGLHFR